MNSFIEIEISQIWWHTFMVLATWKAEVGGLQSEASPGKKHKTLPEKQTKSKRTGNVAQVVELLHSKCRALV
jgi:hypothetical protein